MIYYILVFLYLLIQNSFCSDLIFFGGHVAMIFACCEC